MKNKQLKQKTAMNASHSMNFFNKGIISISIWLLTFLFLPFVAFTQTDPPGDVVTNPILGQHKILFIRLIYPDDSKIVLTAAEAAVHAQELKAIFTANSYDQLDLIVDVTPLLMMPQSKSFYELDNRLSFVRIRADAFKIAEDAGFLESEYDREIIFTEKLWPLPFNGVAGFNRRTCFMSTKKSTLSAHEVGHTFDWRHANFWRVNSTNPIDTAGVLIEYGDKFDIMGDVQNFHHFNPWYKWRVGWIPSKNIKAVVEDGIYCVKALEKPPQSGTEISQYSALKIRRNPDTEYWVYYRSKEELANKGAIISQIHTRNNTNAILLDMEPGSLPEAMDYKDAALIPGKVVKDQEAEIEIEVLEKYSDSLKVRVKIPQIPIDTLPVIDIINPKIGLIVSGIFDYEVTAYDPEMGHINGAGIETLELFLAYSEGDDPFGEGVTTIFRGAKVLTAPPYIYQVDTDTLPDEVYRLIVRATSQNGGVNTAVINHIIDNTGPSVPTAVEIEPSQFSNKYHLKENYPNPFSTATTINYSVGKMGKVELIIYDLFAKKIRILVQENQPSGEYSIIWNGRNDAGNPVPEGSYFYTLKAGEIILTKKLLLLN